MAILSAALWAGASPLNKGEERVALRPFCLVIAVYVAVASELMISPLLIWRRMATQAVAYATLFSPRKVERAEPAGRRER